MWSLINVHHTGEPQSPDTNSSLNVDTPNSQSNGASSPTDSNHGPPATPSSNHHAAGKVMKSARYKKGKNKARNRSVLSEPVQQVLMYSWEWAVIWGKLMTTQLVQQVLMYCCGWAVNVILGKLMTTR